MKWAGAVVTCCAVLISLAPGSGFGVSPIESNFDTGLEGWRIADLTSYGPYTNVLAYYNLTWRATGGSPGGYAEGADPSTRSFFFDAPTNFLGGLSPFIGGLLEFKLRSTQSSWAADSVVVFVGKIGARTRGLVAAIAPLPGTNWTSYAIPLSASNFMYDTNNGATVSAADFLSVMTNVSALRICGEYGAQVAETVGLDAVRLSIRPTLMITAVGTNGVVFWPGWATNYQLESVMGLPPASWCGVTTAPVSFLGDLWVTNPLLPGCCFFRLKATN